MTAWLAPALAYVEDWLGFQQRLHEQPGVSAAILQGSDLKLEAAFGSADLATGEALTPRHGFRPASCG